ncbi:hypothetical protein F2Q70_00021808 [Brassica cretica]|uniref:Uncharacterized protein n=1 Tax=Brassica cretica TaxID=69181 RepID=A0A8S9GLW1_BRACR|nr:hypothetical protein F2Q70_00021808 [Brassica cretica]
MESWTDVNVKWNDLTEFDPRTPDSPDVDSDGEDRRERNDNNIEKEALNFVDEPPVKHNLYLETDDDEEKQVFISVIAFKEAVLDYFLKTGQNIKQNRYDKTKITFVCEGKGDGRLQIWPIGPEPSIIEPEIPDQPGRKKVTKADKKIKKGVNESPSKKKEKFLKEIMHCGICGAVNNNFRFHKNPRKLEASQGVCTQAIQLEK